MIGSILMWWPLASILGKTVICKVAGFSEFLAHVLTDVSLCHRALSVVRRRPSSVVVRRPASSVVASHNSKTIGPMNLKLFVWVPWPNPRRSFFRFSNRTLYPPFWPPSWKTDFCHFQGNGDS